MELETKEVKVQQETTPKVQQETTPVTSLKQEVLEPVVETKKRHSSFSPKISISRKIGKIGRNGIH